MHISLRCVIQKILPSWKPPLYLLILSLSQLQPCEKTQGFRASIGFPFMRCSTLSWLHSKVLRFAQRGASVTNVRSYREVRRRLKAIIPLVSCTSCYWFQGFGNPRRLLQICLYKQTPFKNNNIPHLSSNIFMDRFCPDLNKFPVFPCQTQNKKSPVSSPTPATASSCCRTVVPDEKKKTWNSTRRGGSADWSCCLDPNPSWGGQEQKSWSGIIFHSNIWRFWTSCSKGMHVCWRSQNLRNHLSDIEATRILGSLAAFIWISASRPSISWWRRLEKEQLVKRHGAGMPWIRNYSNFMVNPKPLNIQQTKK